MPNKFLLFVLAFIPTISFAQFITHGPVIGGVTDTKARVYVRTHQLQNITIEVSEDAQFNTGVSTFNGDTREILDTAVIIDLTDLDPETQYYYRFLIDGQYDTLDGSFKTFPAVGQSGNYKIVVGSCDYFYNPEIFEQIEAWQPDLFIHLGDWGWPPNAGGPNFNLYPKQIAKTYVYRYDDENFRKHIFRQIPVEYVYDDDMAINDCEGWTVPREGFTTDSTGTIYNYIEYDSLPHGTREGAVVGYYRNFPTYPAVDTTDGIYHSFSIGNLEVFMTDNRTTHTARAEAYDYDAGTNLWSFNPDTNTTLLGPTQRNWLVNGLRSSTADWKIIGTGVVFNQKYRRLIDFGMAAPIQSLVFDFAGRTGTGVTLSTSFVYNWAGAPVDINAILNLKNEGVKDIVFVSGDSHSGVLDDGTNAGFPEMNASGLAAGDEGYLNYYIDSIGQLIGFPPVGDSLWNGGGNGIGNINFNDTYGTIETFGSDSLRMCIIDEFGQTLGCVTIRHSSLPDGMETRIHRDDNIIKVVYPNPAKTSLQIQLKEGYIPTTSDKCEVFDSNGKLVKAISIAKMKDGKYTLGLDQFADGNYILRYLNLETEHSIKFTVTK